MKIQIEPRKDIMEIKSSLNKVTYLSYLNYQAVIPKAPEDVRLRVAKRQAPRQDVAAFCKLLEFFPIKIIF